MDKTQFFNRYKITSIPVEGVENLHCRALTAKQFLEINQDQDVAKKNALMVLWSCCDEQGNLIFDENDLEAILNLPAWVTNSITSAFLAVNKVTANGYEEVKKK